MWTREPAAECGGRTRLLPDDRRRKRCGSAPRPDFFCIGAKLRFAPRTPGREKVGGTAEHGYLHCGPNGAGHFVKMVHNGIEYGIMAAYAEGLNILQHANVGKQQQTVDAETTPLRNPEVYQYDFNLADMAEVWRRGIVISSWLLDLTADALSKSPDLDEYSGHVSDSGEARWTIKAPSTSRCPRRSSAPRSGSDLSHGAKGSLPPRCSPPCGRASADTPRGRRSAS